MVLVHITRGGLRILRHLRVASMRDDAEHAARLERGSWRRGVALPAKHHPVVQIAELSTRSAQPAGAISFFAGGAASVVVITLPYRSGRIRSFSR